MDRNNEELKRDEIGRLISADKVQGTPVFPLLWPSRQSAATKAYRIGFALSTNDNCECR